MEQQNKSGAVPDSILEKIQKLLALAKAPGTPEEGATAMAMVNNLLLKHNLDISQVHQHKVDEKNVIEFWFELEELQGRHDAGFGMKLISAICTFNFCRPIVHPMSRHKYDQGKASIIGQTHNIEIVKYMIDYCRNNIVSMEKSHWKEYTQQYPYGDKRNTYRRGFYQGCVEAIVLRLAVQEKMTVEEKAKEMNVPVHVVQSNMQLMVVNNKEAVDTKLREIYPMLGKARPRRRLQGNDGIGDGREAGSKLNLAKGITGNESAGNIGR